VAGSRLSSCAMWASRSMRGDSSCNARAGAGTPRQRAVLSGSPTPVGRLS